MSTRSYRSAVRAEAARATRAAIIDAARALFIEGGYAPTSVAAIAERAGVALNTVYTSVGGKPALIEAIAQDATGDTAIESVLDTVDASADGDEILRITARGTAEVTRSQAEILRFLLENRASEPAVASAADAAINLYRARLARVAGRLAAIGALRPGLTADRAADMLWFYFGASAWSSVQQLAWDWDEAAGWLHSQAASALLARPRFTAG